MREGQDEFNHVSGNPQRRCNAIHQEGELVERDIRYHANITNMIIVIINKFSNVLLTSKQKNSYAHYHYFNIQSLTSSLKFLTVVQNGEA